MPTHLKSVVLTFWTTGEHLLGQFFAGETLQTPHQTQIRCYKSLILFAMVNCLSLEMEAFNTNSKLVENSYLTFSLNNFVMMNGFMCLETETFNPP